MKNSDADPSGSDLIGKIRDILTRRLPGTAQPESPSGDDDGSLVSKIIEILNSPLPGTQGVETSPEAGRGSIPQPSPVPKRDEPEEDRSEYPYRGGDADQAWERLKRRHEEEREELKRRHEREREEMKHGHKMAWEGGKDESRQKDENHERRHPHGGPPGRRK